MKKIKMIVVSNPNEKEVTRAVLEYAGKGNVQIRGNDNVSFYCGSCDDLMVKRFDVTKRVAYPYFVLHCTKCGSYNDIPTERNN